MTVVRNTTITNDVQIFDFRRTVGAVAVDDEVTLTSGVGTGAGEAAAGGAATDCWLLDDNSRLVGGIRLAPRGTSVDGNTKTFGALTFLESTGETAERTEDDEAAAAGMVSGADDAEVLG